MLLNGIFQRKNIAQNVFKFENILKHPTFSLSNKILKKRFYKYTNANFQAFVRLSVLK